MSDEQAAPQIQPEETSDTPSSTTPLTAVIEPEVGFSGRPASARLRRNRARADLRQQNRSGANQRGEEENTSEEEERVRPPTSIFGKVHAWVSNPDNLGTVQVVLVCNTVLTSLFFYITQLIYGPNHNPFILPTPQQMAAAASKASFEEEEVALPVVDTTFEEEFDVNRSGL